MVFEGLFEGYRQQYLSEMLKTVGELLTHLLTAPPTHMSEDSEES